MIKVHPHALYSRADLTEMLEPLGIDADAFVASEEKEEREVLEQ